MRTVFIADDGKTFDTYVECEEYEITSLRKDYKKINLANIPVGARFFRHGKMCLNVGRIPLPSDQYYCICEFDKPEKITSVYGYAYDCYYSEKDEYNMKFVK